jgi:hypothetical protein
MSTGHLKKSKNDGEKWISAISFKHIQIKIRFLDGRLYVKGAKLRISGDVK